MKLLSLKAENPRIIKVEFSGGSSFLLSTDYLNNLSIERENLNLWEEGRELSPIEEEDLYFAAACYKAEKAALRLIARAEQSSLGLSLKLEKRGIDAAVVRSVISWLLDKNLLDNERFAELWVRSRLSRKAMSPLGFLVSLGKRGIDRNSSLNAIKKVLDEETEYTLLTNYLDKMDNLKNSGIKTLRKRLKYEGFSQELIDRFFDSSC